MVAGDGARDGSDGSPRALVDDDQLPPAFEPYAAEEVPQAPPGAPGKDGRLELVFAPAEGGTRVVRDFARVPFHLSGSLDHDAECPDCATVYVQNPTGGLAQGDRHCARIEAKPGAVAHVTTGSATKVLSMNRNYARSTVDLGVGAGAHLEYLPEQSILHADSRLYQRVRVDLAAEATAIVGEIAVPGRLARGEAFDFERYYSRTTVSGPDGLLAEDTTHLRPGGSDPRRPGVLGEHSVYGTLYVLAGPGADVDAGELSDRLHERVSAGPGRAGASTLPAGAGAVVRALGDRADAVRAALHAGWDEARSELLGAGAPARRKN